MPSERAIRGLQPSRVDKMSIPWEENIIPYGSVQVDDEFQARKLDFPHSELTKKNLWTGATKKVSLGA